LINLSNGCHLIQCVVAVAAKHPCSLAYLNITKNIEKHVLLLMDEDGYKNCCLDIVYVQCIIMIIKSTNMNKKILEVEVFAPHRDGHLETREEYPNHKYFYSCEN
jgi:hypothetical protein